MSRGGREALFERLGIASAEEPPAAADDPRAALAAAMGQPADDDEQAETRLAALDQREWRRGLPPLCVMPAAESPAVEAMLPAAAASGALDYVLEREDGSREAGELQAAGMPRLGERSLQGESWCCLRVTLPVSVPPGYHRLWLAAGDEPSWQASTTLALAPARAYRPAALEGEGRVFGLQVRLHALRSARNWGVGDFTDLLRLVEFAAGAGAGFVGVGGLHAMLPPHAPPAGPRGPSSRRFLDTLYVDPEAVPEATGCADLRARLADESFQAGLRTLRAEQRVAGEAVARLKAEALLDLYRHFRDRHLAADDQRARAFLEFRRECGEALRMHALFEALAAHLSERSPDAADWPSWPAVYRDPHSTAVAEFARRHAEAVEAREYAQWQAREQLDHVGRRSAELGLAVGLCHDLPAGVAAGGADIWCAPSLHAEGVRLAVAADPDGHGGPLLRPWNGLALRDAGFEPFLAALRGAMRAAGALRVEEVATLARQHWVPDGAATGGWLRQPMSELLDLLVLESHRNRCLVVGGGSARAPAELREAMRDRALPGAALLHESRGADGAFPAPADFEADARLAASGDDLPALAQWWAGSDLERRREQGLDAQRLETEVVRRAESRARLLLALHREGLLAEGRTDSLAFPVMDAALAAAVHHYLARTPARMLAVRLEDLLCEPTPAGAGDEAWPDWRQKLPLDIEAWHEAPRVEAVLAALREERGRAVTAPPPASATSDAPRRAVIPRATYRLQFDAEHGFDHAASLVPYLAALGVSHAYCAPWLQARAGSSHGYDICDHGAVNAELGGEAAFERFAETLERHGMGQVMDMVPNHMGVMGADNAWWLDVLENGPASLHAEFFDIDWRPFKDELRGKVLVPVLGNHYGHVLDSGELAVRLDAEAGTLSVYYYEHRFPLDPRSYPLLLGRRLELLEARLDADAPLLLEFQSLLTAFANLPPREDASPEAVAERARDKAILQARLASMAADSADLGAYLDDCLRDCNGAPGHPADRAQLHELLEAQAYRLAWWRVACDDINYRRFFDINDLAALRMEREEVFDAAHGRVLELIARGRVEGLRIDHPDGLYDPAAYFRRVQSRVTALAGGGAPPEQGLAFYLVAEKILAADESLPEDWAVHGSTGYEFSALAGGVFVDPRGAEPLTRAWADFAGAAPELADIEHRCKHLVMEESLSAELNVLSRELSRIAESDPRTRDMTEPTLRRALAEVVACFPVYRTYVAGEPASPRDAARIQQALASARRRARTIEGSVFDFVGDAMLGHAAQGRGEAARARVLRFAMRCQQLTAPVTAKGVEDTAFYRHHRLHALNEVGDDPSRFGVEPADLHAFLAERAARWPHAMLCTSTHDSKRSEDVRMRLAVLSELPEEWAARARRWAELNRPHRVAVDGAERPDADAEYAFYQALLGIWPLAGETAATAAALAPRLRTHVVKAAREAKRHTTWTSPDAAYEEALEAFVEAVLDERRSAAFLADFTEFQRRVARPGLFNSLGLSLLKLTAPGVPDVYQGNELWRFDLVDPDNRRPVDQARRRAMLETLQTAVADEGAAAVAARLAQAPEDGALKLYLIWRALAARRSEPALFADAGYQPLEVTGERARHLLGFARRAEGRFAVVLVPRLLAGLTGERGLAPLGEGSWGDTRVRLPAGVRLRDAFTERLHEPPARDSTLAVADALADFPVGLLVGGPGEPP